jgi:radical SAM superfamily enzyme YgiQ (UPF0313 family)
MRILLVKPHPELLVARRLQQGFLHLEPLELEIVAGGVPQADEVAIVDLSLEKHPFHSFKKELIRTAPDLVGLTGYSTNVSVIRKLAAIVKHHNPVIQTIVGGVHATLLPKDYATKDIDIVARGEGGTLFRDLIPRLKRGETPAMDGRALFTRDPDFNPKAELPPPTYPEAKEVPLPRRDLVKRSRYFCTWTSSSRRNLDTMFPQVASLRTSIGCAFSCSFCVVPFLMHGKYRQWDPKDVVDQIETLQETHVYFVDDEMFLNVPRATHIAQLLIQRGIKKQYISWTRSDTIVKHPDMLRLWRKAGLRVLYVGLESMDISRLNEYEKRTDVETNKRAVELLNELGITLHASFIVHPDFTVQDFRRLEKTVTQICPAEVSFTVLAPSPATPFWHEHKHEFICDPYRFYDCMHSILPTRLPLKQFYQHFGRLTSIALRANPLRVNRIRVPFRELIRAIVVGTQYVFALQNMHRDYPLER